MIYNSWFYCYRIYVLTYIHNFYIRTYVSFKMNKHLQLYHARSSCQNEGNVSSAGWLYICNHQNHDFLKIGFQYYHDVGNQISPQTVLISFRASQISASGPYMLQVDLSLIHLLSEIRRNQTWTGKTTVSCLISQWPSFVFRTRCRIHINTFKVHISLSALAIFICQSDYI